MSLALDERLAPTFALDPDPALDAGLDPTHGNDLDRAPASADAETERDAEVDPKAELTADVEAPDRSAEVRPRNRRARAMKGTGHRRFDLSMSTYVKDGNEGGAIMDRRRDRTAAEMEVDVVADKGAGFTVDPLARPTEEQLFQKKEQGRRVKFQRGTIEKPNTHQVMEPEKLFIGGAPSTADIRQGGIGDCYFEAALLSVVNNDPGQISKMVSMEGNTAAVTFHRQVNGVWKPVIIRTSDQLLTRRGDDGSRGLVGTGVRLAEAPLESTWWADTSGSTLELHRRNVWEVALWAALVEKAYAEFAQRYGQFGRGFADDPELKGKGGYDILDTGGWAEDCYGMLYGNSASEALNHSMEFSTAADLLIQNKRTLTHLVTYEANRTNTAAGQTQTFLDVSISDSESVQRSASFCDDVLAQIAGEGLLDGLVGSVAPDGDEARVARSMRGVGRTLLSTQLHVYKALLGSYDENDKASRDSTATLASALSQPDLHPALWDDSLAPCYRYLRESLGVVSNLGTDHGPGRRMVYANHAYNVKRVHLRDRSGGVLELSPGEVGTRIGDIDARTSVVVIENPHAGNEPDLRGESPADKRPDGRFELTLEQFLLHFASLGIANVAH